MSKNLIFVASPFRDNPQSVVETIKYCRKLLLEGKVPIAPHLYFPQLLSDDAALERELGIEAGKAILRYCVQIHTIEDWGISEGMKGEIELAELLAIPRIRVKNGVRGFDPL